MNILRGLHFKKTFGYLCQILEDYRLSIKTFCVKSELPVTGRQQPKL